MKKILLSAGINLLCLIASLLLTACHPAPIRPELNAVRTVGHAPGYYIDPTKSLFTLSG